LAEDVAAPFVDLVPLVVLVEGVGKVLVDGVAEASAEEHTDVPADEHEDVYSS
jgi:hypothetical protein